MGYATRHRGHRQPGSKNTADGNKKIEKIFIDEAARLVLPK
jgi:hypothetical protein